MHATRGRPPPSLPAALGAALAVVLSSMTLGGCRPDPRSAPVADGGAPPPPSHVGQAAVNAEALRLQIGGRLSRSIAGGAADAFRLDLAAGSVVALTVEQQGIDLELRVASQDGDPRVRSDRRDGTRGAERALLFTERDERLHIEVASVWGDVPAGSYTLTVGTPRRAEPTDRQAAAAERLFAVAEDLREQQDQASCRRAASVYQEALEAASALDDRERQAEILQRLGWVHRKYLEEKRAALEYYRRALLLYRDLGAARRQSGILNNLGRVHFDLGEMDEAATDWSAALELKRQTGDHLGEAAALSNLGLAARYRGNLQAALAYYDRALDLLRTLGARAEEARALNNRGRFYDTLGQPSQALADLQAAVAISREIGDGSLRAAALTAIGRIEDRQGEPAEALAVLEEALGLRLESGSRRGRAVTLRALGSVHEQLGHDEKALELDREALSVFADLEAPREEADTLAAIGRLALSGGQAREARGYFERAVELCRAARDVHGEITALFGMAEARRQVGDVASASALMEEALGRIETVQGRISSYALSSRYLAARQNYYDLYVDLLMQLDRAAPGAGYAAKALEIQERSRARALLDLLASDRTRRQAGADASLLAREHQIETALEALDSQRLELQDKAGARTRILERRLDGLLRDLDSIRARIRSRSPDLAELVHPDPLGLARIRQEVLDDDTLLLEYRLGEERSFLWAATRRSLDSYELPPRAALERSARRAYELLKVSNHREFRAQSRLALRNLSDLLLAPAADRIDAAKRCVVVADGALHYIPFGVLPAPGPSANDSRARSAEEAVGNEAPLLARVDVIHLPSISALALVRRRSTERRTGQGTVAVLADPVLDASDPRILRQVPQLAATSGSDPAEVSHRERSSRRLAYSQDEADAIVSIAGPDASLRAVGFDASREALLDPGLARYRILHLATHVEVDSRRPELTRVLLSRFDRQGHLRNGSFYAHEAFALRLPTDLVVLSGCDTALGLEIRGEGLIGLAQGFLHAGAARVLVSSWRADDRATAALMTRFYGHYLQGGLPAATALRKAQLEIRDRGAWEAPYYWAGFTLQGEWR